jgi:hypothetical protein
VTVEQGNESLSRLLVQSGWSRKAFARAVRDEATARGLTLACDHTAIGRWLAGMVPRRETAEVMAYVLGRRLGLSLSLADLGLRDGAPADAGLGASYPRSAVVAAETVSRLWAADLDGVAGVTAAPVEAGLWADASLSWLVRPGGDEVPERPTGRLVGLADVEAVEATTQMFDRLDNRFGGEHARPALVQYLRSDVEPLLSGSYSEPVGRRLFGAAAQACLLLAWMSYDSGNHGLAQRYFAQGLRLAQAGEDVLLAASILDAMSHQATFLGRFHHAANLARAAQAGTRDRRAPRLQAHFLAMEARALAGAGEREAVIRLLGQAGEVHAQPGGDDPEWISYFDEPELAAEHGHCFRDLGIPTRGSDYASRALSPNGSSPRSDFFVLMVLGQTQVENGDVEEGCTTLARAAELRRRLKSARCADYEKRVKRSLEPHLRTQPVRELYEAAGWAAAA